MASSAPESPPKTDAGPTTGGASSTGDAPAARRPSRTSESEGGTPATLADAFKLFASKGSGKEATSADITKWCKDAGVVGKACSSNHIDIAFTKAKAKAAKNITMVEMEALIDEMAKEYKKDHKITDDDAAKKQLSEKLAKTKPKAHGTTKVSKAGGVDRMTDTSKYTGAHKERFDESGKGKGKDGREETKKNTGYVGAYKGEGTHDKKVAAPPKKK